MAKTSSPKSSSPLLTALALALAGLLVPVAPALAQSSDKLDTAADRGAAKDTYARAVALYKEGQAEQALPLFLEVADATKSPNARLLVGRCYQDLRRYVDAYKAFAQTVREINEQNDDRYEETREAAVAQLSLLTARVAKLVVSVAETPAGLTVTVDGTALKEKEIGSSLVLEPGAHRVEARAPGTAPVVRAVEIEGGEVKTITLAFEDAAQGRSSAEAAPAPPSAARERDGSTLRTLGLVSGGVGVGGFALFTVAGLMAKGTYGDLESECGAAGCSDERIHRGKTQQTLANVGLVVGAVGIAAGGTLFYLGTRRRTGKEAGVSVAAAPGYGMISYRSSFR